MPTEQRHAWSALTVTGAFVIYLLITFRTGGSMDLLLIMPLLVVVAVITRLLLVVGETKGRDERDRSIAARSIRNAHFVLLAGIGSLVFCIVPLGLVTSIDELVRLMAVGFALSELARYASQLFYYQKA